MGRYKYVYVPVSDNVERVRVRAVRCAGARPGVDVAAPRHAGDRALGRLVGRAAHTERVHRECCQFATLTIAGFVDAHRHAYGALKSLLTTASAARTARVGVHYIINC